MSNRSLLHVSMSSSSSSVAAGLSYDLSMAARKLSLQPRPLMMRGRGLWKGMSPFSVTSATAVCKLSRELDFLRPKKGPTSLVEDPGEEQQYQNLLIWLSCEGTKGDCILLMQGCVQLKHLEILLDYPWVEMKTWMELTLTCNQNRLCCIEKKVE